MEEWKTYKIGEICESISDTYKGKAPNVVLVNTSDVYDGVCLNHAYVPNKDLKGQFKKTFKRNDILYSEIRPANRRFAFIDFEPENYIASTKLMVIRCSKIVRPRYLYHYLKRQEMLLELQALAESRSGTFPQITFSELALFEINLPNLATQDKIVAMIDCFDNKIAINNRINHNLEEQAKALYKSWFVDFEPFNGHFPDSWEMGVLSDILSLKRDTIRKEQVSDLPYLPIDLIPMHSFTIDNFADNSEAQSSLQVFLRNDILIGAMRVYFHRVVPAPCQGVTRNTCFVLRPVTNNIFGYALMTCNQDSTIAYAQRTSKGSTMPYAVWDGALANMNVIIPDEDTAKRFNGVVKNLIEKIQNNSANNFRLRSLRDAILPKLMSGELSLIS